MGLSAPAYVFAVDDIGDITPSSWSAGVQPTTAVNARGGWRLSTSWGFMLLSHVRRVTCGLGTARGRCLAGRYRSRGARKLCRSPSSVRALELVHSRQEHLKVVRHAMLGNGLGQALHIEDARRHVIQLRGRLHKPNIARR